MDEYEDLGESESAAMMLRSAQDWEILLNTVRPTDRQEHIWNPKPRTEENSNG